MVEARQAEKRLSFFIRLIKKIKRVKVKIELFRERH